MSTDLNFKVKRILFALFPKNFNSSNNIVSIVYNLKQKIKFFDGEDTISSFADAPADIPRAILRSNDDRFKCAIALSRIDFILELKEEGENNITAILDNNEYFLKTNLFYSYFLDDLNLSIGRIGFVVDFFVDLPLGESSNKLIQNELLKEKSYLTSVEDPKNISLLFTEKDTMVSLEINRAIKIDTLRKTDTGDDRRLTFRYDINTAIEKILEYNLSTDNINNILKEVSSEIRNTDNINKYFKQTNE